MMTNKVIIVKPERLAGTVAYKKGDCFRYPGQNFWVHPVILENGQKELAFQIQELPMNDKIAADYINGFLNSKITLNLNPYIVYDYHDLESQAKCPTCGSAMTWMFRDIDTKSNKDKFCYAECCGMQYSMVPEKVRVIAVPLASLQPKDDRICDVDADDADEDFLSELERLK